MNKILLSALILLTPVAVSAVEEGGAMCAACPAEAGAVADITVADLKAAIAAKTVVLVDANGTEKFGKGHLPGAVDFAANAKDLAKVLPADKAALVVAYCGGPKCSAWKSAAAAVAKLGYTNVKHFSGGLKGWQEAGEKLEASVQ